VQLAEKLGSINRWDKKTINTLMLWNDSLELKAPFAMYKALRQNGVDEKSAAATVLGTMNFGKTGRAMAPIKALYMFGQPVVTGSHQLIKTLSTKKGVALGLGLMAASMGLYAALSEMGGDDEATKKRKIDQLGSFTIERSIPIYMDGTEVLKVPVPFGLYQATWGAGANLMRAINGSQTWAETFGELAKSGVKTFSPLGTSEIPALRDPFTWFWQTVTPAVLKPTMNIALNKNAFGGSIAPTVNPGEPAWKVARKNTPEEYVSASKTLLNDYGLNITAESIQELTRGVAYGLLGEALKASITNPAKERRGIEYPPQWLDRYVMEQTPAQITSSLYYKALDEARVVREKKNSGGKGQVQLDVTERRIDALLTMDKRTSSTVQAQWSALRKQKNDNRLTGEQFKTRYQQILELETNARRRFVLQYNEITK
jgi:hypothetical protein